MLYAPIITALGAIAGGIAGTYFLGRNARKLEEMKQRREDELQCRINIRLRMFVYGELVHLSDIMNNIITIPTDLTFKEANIMLSYSREYPRMPLEKRALIFESDVLDEIESAYKTYENFNALFNVHYERYTKHELNLEQLKQILNTDKYKSAIDKAINAMYERREALGIRVIEVVS